MVSIKSPNPTNAGSNQEQKQEMLHDVRKIESNA
jgi:hypothetical protein